MERAVALKTLGKLLGKQFGYRVNAKAPTQEERDVAKAAAAEAVEERNKLKDQRRARFEAILAADAEYQSLCAAYKAASERVDKLFSITHHYKITVGTSAGMFFLVKAEGDSWEEVIDKLAAKGKKAA